MYKVGLTDKGRLIFFPSLPQPELYTATNNYFYFGWWSTSAVWQNASGGWLIQRQKRPIGRIESANSQNNPNYTVLDAAWNTRNTLNYQ